MLRTCLALTVCLVFTSAFGMNVPGNASGTTCSGGNTCALFSGFDHVETLNVSSSGNFTFRMNGSAIAAELAIGTSPCTNDVAVTDGVCLGRKSITCVFLNPGTYYATIDCGTPACCGTWELVAEACIPAIGETGANPIVIGALPYSTDNNTDCHANDINNAACTNGSSGPDLFYRYTPASNTTINISLTENGFQFFYNRLIVDGICHTGTGSTVTVSNYAVTAGIPVDIVVDGCCDHSIDYNLQVWDLSPFCVVGCDFYFQEPEVCAAEYIDNYNCGCDGTTPVFNVWNGWGGVCGKSGTYLLNGEARGESDWYQFDFASPVSVSFSFRGEFPLRARWWQSGPNGCADRTLLDERDASPCVNTFYAANPVQTGQYWMEIRPQITDGISCNARYIFTVFVQVLPVVAPSRLVISSNAPDIQLYWNDTGANIYHIYRSAIEPVATNPANLVGTTSDTTYTDVGILSTETQLYYVVTAQN